MIFNIGGAENLKGKLPEMSYTGSWSGIVDEGVVNGVQNWYARFYTSGKLTFGKVAKDVEVFVLGAGAGGAYMVGGGSGEVNTQKITVKSGETYDIVIGAGGDGQNNGSTKDATAGGATTALGVTAVGGKAGRAGTKGGNGGSGGAGVGVNLTGGSDGADGGGSAPGTGKHKTTREFGDAEGKLYSHGGNTAAHNQAGVNASDNMGHGGRGSGSVNSGPALASGNGSSGIAAIRNAR